MLIAIAMIKAAYITEKFQKKMHQLRITVY